MLKSTETAVNAILAADPSVTDDVRNAVILAMRGGNKSADRTKITDYALTRKEVANLFCIKPHTVSDWVRRGLLKPFRFGKQGKLASGYSAESVKALMEGRNI